MGRSVPYKDLRESEHQDENGYTLKVGSFELIRNTRPDSTPAGTRAVSVVVSAPYPSMYAGSEDDFRAELETRARKAAVHAWRERWGGIAWDMAEGVAAHLTFQCIYQFQVVTRV